MSVRFVVMRLMVWLIALAAVCWVSGCVQGPLVDFGPRDKPFVSVKINSDDKDSTSAKKKDKKSSSRREDSDD